MFYLFCSGSKIILDIHYFNFLQVSVIHVFLAWKPNLDPEGYSVIWPVGEFGQEFAAGPQGIVFCLFVLQGI